MFSRPGLVLLFVMLLMASLLALLRTPSGTSGLTRQAVQSYSVDIGSLSATMRFAMGGGKVLALACNPRAASCPARALKQGLLWRPEAAVWFSGGTVGLVELNGQTIYDYSQAARTRLWICLGVAVLTLLALGLLGLLHLVERRRDDDFGYQDFSETAR